jgi:hypothetical protein
MTLKYALAAALVVGFAGDGFMSFDRRSIPD